MSQSSILGEIRRERIRQDKKFGADRIMKPYEWLMILGEEVGEANHHALEAHFFGAKGAETEDPSIQMAAYRAELIQIAAVAVAALESLDLQKPNLGEKLQMVRAMVLLTCQECLIVKPDVKEQLDPYTLEVLNERRLVTICNDCRQDRMADI
jgi:hypothetical protein